MSAVSTTVTSPPRVSVRLAVIGAFIGGHVVLALLMRVFPVVGLLHAVACLAAGIYIAATRRIQQTAYVMAYMTGSEVLWRMTHAGVFWEFGKYSVAAVALVALLRVRARNNRGLAFAYFGFLLPSALLTLGALDLEAARQQLSFNLSGPLCLMLCVLLFSNMRLSADEVRTTFLALIGPVLGIAAIAYFTTVSSDDLEFTHASNSVTSGGFGPNQVSAMLGLALLFTMLMLFERRLPWRLKGPLIGIAMFLAVQAALTFSRGGLAMAFAGTIVALFYLVRDARARVTLVILAALFYGVGRYVVVPRLETFTAGKLGERYTSADPTGRGLLAGYDLEIFKDNPVMGVGPGVAARMRGELGHFGAAHTEFTRMLSEHGILGALSIVFYFVLCGVTLRRARTLHARAFVAAMLLWVALFLVVNAMRTAAPAFLFGLACSVAYSSTRPRPAVAIPA